MLFIVTLLTAALRMAVPIGYSALGETFAEKSGILNIGMEGQMLVGAYFAVSTVYATKSIYLGLLVAGISGMIGALIIAYLCISRKQDQTVVGIMFNLFASGFTSYLFRAFYGSGSASSGNLPTISGFPTITIPLLSKIPILGSVFFNQNIMVYMLIILSIILWFELNHLKIGLQLKSVGENPRVSQACGINVILTRYVTMIIGGFLTGIGGAYLSIDILGKFQEDMSGGRGFIALAVVILGRWNPLLTLAGVFIFGIADALQLRMQAFGINIPYQFMLMMPYLIVLLSFTTMGRGVTAPKSLCKVFEKEGR